MADLNGIIRVARGDMPADLLLRNAQLVNVYFPIACRQSRVGINDDP